MRRTPRPNSRIPSKWRVLVPVLLAACSQDPAVFALIDISSTPGVRTCAVEWLGTVQRDGFGVSEPPDPSLGPYADTLWARVDSGLPHGFVLAGAITGHPNGKIVWNGPPAADSAAMVFQWRIIGAGLDTRETGSAMRCGATYDTSSLP